MRPNGTIPKRRRKRQKLGQNETVPKCPKKWRRTCSEDFRNNVIAKRNAKIMELHEEGQSIRAIAAAAGCGVATVDRVLNSVPKRNSCETEHLEDCPQEDDAPFTHGFSDEELEEVEVINPMDAMSKGDQKTAYTEMCELHKETFGFNASKVVALLESWGMCQGSNSWLSKCTKHVRDELKAKMSEEIVRLDAEGKTQREIAEEVVCAQRTVSNILNRVSEQKQHSAENAQDSTCPFDVEEEENLLTPEEAASPEFMGFDDEELDDSPAINPQDAENKALAEFNERLKEKTNALEFRCCRAVSAMRSAALT